MKLKKIMLLGMAISTLTVSSAYAGVRLNLLGGVDYNMSSGAVTNIGYAAGGTIEIRSGSVGFESGFIYTLRDMSHTGGGIGTYGDIPVVLRLHLGRAVSLGLGGFYELPMSSTVSAFYGATADITIRASLGRKAAFILRPRYSYDLSNTGASQLNFLSGLAGFQFGM
jgi:hypothetical protein